MAAAQVSGRRLTNAGKRYILQTLDPFHDSSYQVVSRPDGHLGRSLVYPVVKRTTITKDATMHAADAGKWDCHIAFVPDYRDANFRVHSGIADGIITELAHDYFELPPGMIVIWQVPTGDNTWSAITTASAEAAIEGIVVDPFESNFNSTVRVIGGGFEVRNVTEEVSKSGDVVVYRQELASPNQQAAVEGVTLTPSRGGIQGVVVRRRPPPTASYAVKLDSAAWEARDGAYVPFFPAGMEAMPFERNVTRPLVYDTNSTSLCFANGDFTSLPAATAEETPNVNISFPWLQSGAFFTGLHPDTALQLDLRIFLEKIPGVGDSAVQLARPMPPLDWEAIKAVSMAAHYLPPGVPVTENASGDYWRMTKKALVGGLSIAEELADVGDDFEVPGARTVRKVARGLKTVVRRY